MIRVQEEDFDMGREVAALYEGKQEIGAVCTFLGLVRDLPDSDGLKTMTLEHYPGMTEKQLERLESEARERWDLQDVLIIHRYGKLYPGDRIVLVITASPHRQASLESCHFLIDWLKTKAPFWKLEEKESGADWVDARETDSVAAGRWVRVSDT